MKFYDKVKISLQSWKWWDWLASWRREAKVPYWWPSGWDGWNWGDIILKASKDENTLLKFKYNKIHKAEKWMPWMSKDMYWKSGNNLVLNLPIWTLVKDVKTGKVLYQFTQDWEEFKILRWWRWGWGNIHFKNSTNQYPEFALLWEPSISMEIELELQLLWDICLIGTPSVWKSTIINSVSNAKAKVADYPFTTIVPNLWMVKRYDKDFCIVDIPGLVEWAGQWKWLWFNFLRHILKGSNWIFVSDLSRLDSWINDFSLLFNEIIAYLEYRYIWSFEFWEKINWIDFELFEDDWLIAFLAYWIFLDWSKEKLFKKYISFIVNKLDLVSDEYIVSEYHVSYINSIFEKLSNYWNISKDSISQNTIYLSAANKRWTDEFLDLSYKTLTKVNISDYISYTWEMVCDLKDNYVKDITLDELNYLTQEWYLNEAFDWKIWEIYHSDFSYFSYILPWWNDQAEKWFWEKMNKEWVLSYFNKMWIKNWDVIKVESDYDLDPIYIKYEY